MVSIFLYMCFATAGWQRHAESFCPKATPQDFGGAIDHSVLELLSLAAVSSESSSNDGLYSLTEQLNSLVQSQLSGLASPAF